MAEPMRLAPGTRRALQIVGVVLAVAGVALTLTGSLTFASSMGDFSRGPPIAAFSMFAIGGFVMVGGFGVSAFAFRKPMSEIAATETELAVEHASAAMGRGLSRGVTEGGALGQIMRTDGTVAKVKCRSCGYLDSEDATYCSGCRATL